MLECRTSSLILFDTVPLWNVPRLLANCGRSARWGTEGPSNSFPIGLEPLPVQVVADCSHQKFMTSCHPANRPANRVQWLYCS